MSARDIVIAIRRSTHLSQTKFAERTNLHRVSISQFETGSRIPLPHHVQKYLKVSKEKLLSFTFEDFYIS